MATTTPESLGTVYLSSAGTPVGSYEFLVNNESGLSVEIGTPVAADTIEGVLVGAVVDMRTMGSGRDPVMDGLSSTTDVLKVAKIPDAVVATVQVFSSPLMRPARAGVIRPATREEMLDATGYSRMEWPIPAGVVGLAGGSEFAKVCLDGKALLGPESAHMIVNGLSGQAAKTSFASVLLSGAMAAGGGEGNRVGALIFNVKGDDLVWIDKQPTAGYELSDEDTRMYEALGIPARPFDDVSVYAPSLPGGSISQSNRDDASLLRWNLEDVWKYLDYILPYYGDDEKVATFMAEFAEYHLYTQSSGSRISSFAALERWFDSKITSVGKEDAGGNVQGPIVWRSHHVATMIRIKRMLMGIVSRSGGLVSREEGDSSDIPVDKWVHGRVVVVDIAGLHGDIQGLVIGRTLQRLLDQAENGDLGVDHLVVFADELNAFAPSSGTEMAKVRKILQRVSTQGRYAGISLWGACQKMSKVDELVRDNAATRAVGITAEGELSSGVYGHLASGLVERLATLPKGSMALWHYSYRGALVVKFPRPAWRTGKAKSGYKRKVATDTLGLSPKSVTRLSEGMTQDTINGIIATHDNPESALAALRKGRIIDVRASVLHEPRVKYEDDPFNVE